MSLEELTDDEKYNKKRHGKIEKPVCRGDSNNMFLKYRLTIDDIPTCCLGGTSCAYLERKDYNSCTATNKQV